MSQDKINIRHIAKLSRLHVEENEIEKFEKDMQSIVGMVENLPEFKETSLDLKAEDAMLLREDEIMPSLSRKKVLQNAPQTEAGCIVVPKIVE
jgi:aspartyl-tRNA(Asn)/glutamyl-tRNA(Gln) amidotransferase subunit C